MAESVNGSAATLPVRLSLSAELGEVGVERGPATLGNHPLLVDREKHDGKAEKGREKKCTCPKANYQMRGRIGQQVSPPSRAKWIGVPPE